MLDQDDQERRRTKKRRSWADRLMNPLTLKALIVVGRAVELIARLILTLIDIFRG